VLRELDSGCAEGGGGLGAFWIGLGSADSGVGLGAFWIDLGCADSGVGLGAFWIDLGCAEGGGGLGCAEGGGGLGCAEGGGGLGAFIRLALVFETDSPPRAKLFSESASESSPSEIGNEIVPTLIKDGYLAKQTKKHGVCRYKVRTSCAESFLH